MNLSTYAAGRARSRPGLGRFSGPVAGAVGALVLAAGLMGPGAAAAARRPAGLPSSPRAGTVKRPVALPPPPPLPSAYRGVAILSGSRFAVADGDADRLEQAVAAEVDEIPNHQAISGTDVRSAVEALGLDAARCDRDVACLAQVARYARAHLALEVSVTALGGALGLGLRLLDGGTAAILGQAAEPLAATGAPRLQQLHRLAVQLLAPQAYTGSFRLLSATQGAEVYLDDHFVGTTPLPEQAGLTAGVHILRLHHPAYADLWRFVEVAYRRSVEMRVDFDRAHISETVLALAPQGGLSGLTLRAELAGVEVRVDGEPLGVTPLAKSSLQLAAGRHRISLRRPGQPATVLEVEVGPAAPTELVVVDRAGRLQLVRAAPAGPSPVQAGPLPPTWRRPLAWGLFAGAGLSLGLAAIFAHRVHGLRAEAAALVAYDLAHEVALTRRVADQHTVRRLNEAGHAAEIWQWVGLAGGGLLALAGGGALFWEARATGRAVAGPVPQTAQAWRLRPTLGPMHGLTVALEGAF